MKVRELIAKLQRENPDAEVHHAYPARDYHRSTLAPPVTRVDEEPVEHSAYHDTFVVVEEEGSAAAVREVVVLR